MKIRDSKRHLAIFAALAILALAVGIPGQAALASGSTYYLSPSGNDSLAGTSESAAWGTFSRAWKSVKAGDTLVLLDGVYRESLYPLYTEGQPGSPITIKAKNDGKAIIDGEGMRIPVRIDHWSGNEWFVIEGIVARNSSEGVYYLSEAHNNVLRRVSGYNANPDGNFHVFAIVLNSTNNLVEDAVASGSGRKMFVIYKSTNNTLRRVFADWRRWDGREWHDTWPWGENIDIYNASGNTVENGIGYGSVPNWSFTVRANTSSAIANDNRVLGSMAVYANVDKATGQSIQWSPPRPQPSEYTGFNDVNADPRDKVGFRIEGPGQLQNNQYKDILAYSSASYGFSLAIGSWDANPVGTTLERVSLLGNSVQVGSEVDALHADLSEVEVVNSRIAKVQNGSTTYGIDGEGARLEHRYVNGVLMDGTNGQPEQALWPWPMEARIKSELGISVTTEMQGIISKASGGSAYSSPTMQATPTPTASTLPSATPTASPTPAAAYEQQSTDPTPVSQPGNGLTAISVEANRTEVPRYEKFELYLDVQGSVATKPEFPYDPTPPAGLAGGTGITVDGLFLPPGMDDWASAIVVPGYLHQEYQWQVRGSRDWLYPQGAPEFRVRFAPTAEGVWRYKARAQDASNYPNWTESPIYSFTATAGTKPGYVRVSKADPRYFQYDDGTPFPGLGINAPYGTISVTEATLQQYANSGIDFIRVWMGGTNVAGSAWAPWERAPSKYYGYIPRPGLGNAPAGSGHDYAFQAAAGENHRHVFSRYLNIAVKPNTTYRVQTKARVEGLVPLDPSKPSGFTVKEYGWPTEDTIPGPGLVPHLGNSEWRTLEGTYTTKSDQYFMQYLHLVLDNAAAGLAQAAYVSLREVLPDGSLGPEILDKNNADMHMDFNQRSSVLWDRALDKAADVGVAIKTVLLEKHDQVYTSLQSDGSTGPESVDNFYSYSGTKVRKLQEYFWRYVAARWGYSTGVHSWELVNEGDPYHSGHYAQTNELAKFMERYDPGNHMVTTSTWHSYPASEFWGNSQYSPVDYGDIHTYPETSPVQLNPLDMAQVHIDVADYVNSRPIGKPVVRGEVGIDPNAYPQMGNDTRGVWLHNFLWSGLHGAPMYDLYWFRTFMDKNSLYFQFRAIQDFLADIRPGGYVKTTAAASDGNVRVVGQVNSSLSWGHLWIQNKNHTWWNVVNGVSYGQLSGTVSVPGLAPGSDHQVEWWQFDSAGNLSKRTESIRSDASGSLVLNLSALPSGVTDAGVKLRKVGSAYPSPTPAPTLSITSTPVPTATLVPTGTPAPTGTPVPTSTPAPTNTPLATSTAEPAGTPTITSTPAPTNTAHVPPGLSDSRHIPPGQAKKN